MFVTDSVIGVNEIQILPINQERDDLVPAKVKTYSKLLYTRNYIMTRFL